MKINPEININSSNFDKEKLAKNIIKKLKDNPPFHFEAYNYFDKDGNVKTGSVTRIHRED